MDEPLQIHLLPDYRLDSTPRPAGQGLAGRPRSVCLMMAQLEGGSRGDSGFILFNGVNCYWVF